MNESITINIKKKKKEVWIWFCGIGKLVTPFS